MTGAAGVVAAIDQYDFGGETNPKLHRLLAFRDIPIGGEMTPSSRHLKYYRCYINAV